MQTGKRPVLAYGQQALLLERAGADEAGCWMSAYADLPPLLGKIHACFVAGFLAGADGAAVGLEGQLEVAQAHFDLLDAALR